MNVFQDFGATLAQSLLYVWDGVARVVPIIILAVIIFAIGWILAILVEKLIESLFKALKIDEALRGAGMEEVVKRAGYNLNSGLFVGALIKWFIIVVALMTSLSMLQLDQVNAFLGQVASYLPSVIVAVLVLMVAAIIAMAMQKAVIASAKAAHVKHAELLGRISKWAIWIFAIVTALEKLGLGLWFIQPALYAIFGGAALALGLAFGLGGKEVAAKMLEKTTSNVLNKE